MPGTTQGGAAIVTNALTIPARGRGLQVIPAKCELRPKWVYEDGKRTDKPVTDDKGWPLYGITALTDSDFTDPVDGYRITVATPNLPPVTFGQILRPTDDAVVKVIDDFKGLELLTPVQASGLAPGKAVRIPLAQLPGQGFDTWPRRSALTRGPQHSNNCTPSWRERTKMNIFVNFIRICFWIFVFLAAFPTTEDPSSPGPTTSHLFKATAVTSVAIIPLVLGRDIPVLRGICRFLLGWGWEPRVVYDIPKDEKDKQKRVRRINRQQKEAWARANPGAATGRKGHNGEEEFKTPRIVRVKDDFRDFVVVVELIVGAPVAKVEAVVDNFAVALGYSWVKVEPSVDERRRVNLVFFLGDPVPAGRIGADWLE